MTLDTLLDDEKVNMNFMGFVRFIEKCKILKH